MVTFIGLGHVVPLGGTYHVIGHVIVTCTCAYRSRSYGATGRQTQKHRSYGATETYP